MKRARRRLVRAARKRHGEEGRVEREKRLLRVGTDAARRFLHRGDSVPLWVGLLGLLEEYVQTWDDPRGVSRGLRVEVYERHAWRCTAPGCTIRRLEDHHLQYRSRRGSDEIANRLGLCPFHHRQGEHGTLARCRGRAPLDVIWMLGREGLETWFQNERRLARAGSRAP